MAFQNCIVDFFVCQLTAGNSQQTWIELCQKAGADPYNLINKNVDKLFEILLAASMVDFTVWSVYHVPESLLSMTFQFGFPDASYRAVKTMAFVSPHVVLPRVVKQLRADINPDLINTLSDSELGIWSTPEGMTYVNGRGATHMYVMIAC
jgi:hypothetical protein